MVMKKLLIFALMVVVLAACKQQTREQIAQKLGEAMIKECLAGLLPKIDERKANSKTLTRLDKVLSAGKINSFIMYEIILPDRPSLAYYLDKKQIESLKDYVIWSNQK